MEKITDEDLKAMLIKNEESSRETINEEVQSIELSEDALFEETPIVNNTDDISLHDNLEQELDFNTIPEIIEEDKPLDPILVEREKLTVGLTPEDIQAFFNYVVGKGEKPEFVDKFMADAEGRIREMTMVMNMVQLSQIPTETAYVNQVTERLFDPVNLYDMDSKTLSATRSNIKKDIAATIENSIKAIQTTSQFGSLNNEYRRLLDTVMMLPADKFKLIQDNVLEDERNLDSKK